MSDNTRIAIIEDDPTISQMYRTKFESEGFDVQVATDGRNGVNLVKNFMPEIILLDLRMPEMNGEEVLAEIRKNDHSKDTPVIILTNTGKEEAPANLGTLNIVDYIVKAEFTPSQVVEVVKRAIS